jgi:GntR family transcriptional regulator
MLIEVDFHLGQPIYLQIVEQIRNKIERGELKPGDQLPTVRQMATELRVNFNTVARSYRILDEAGLISTQQGRGTYVWKTPSAEVVRQLRKREIEELIHDTLAEAQKMGYSIEEIANVIKQEMDGMSRTQSESEFTREAD